MSESNVLDSEMRKFWSLSEAEMARVIAGQELVTDEELKEVARFFKDVGDAYPETSTEVHESAHVAAMIQMSQLLAENGELVVEPAGKINEPVSQKSGLSKLRRSIVRRFEVASVKVKMAAAGVALVVMFGGTAFAGVLPEPVQDALAGAAQNIGIDLPDSDQAAATDAKSADVDEGKAADLKDATDPTAIDSSNMAGPEGEDSAAVEDIDESDPDDAHSDEAEDIDEGDPDDEAEDIDEGDPDDADDDLNDMDVDDSDPDSSQID